MQQIGIDFQVIFLGAADNSNLLAKVRWNLCAVNSP